MEDLSTQLMDCLVEMQEQDKKFLAEIHSNMETANKLTEDLKNLCSVAAEYLI